MDFISLAGLWFINVANVFCGDVENYSIKLWRTGNGITLQIIRKEDKQYVDLKTLVDMPFDRPLSGKETIMVLSQLKTGKV